MKRHLKYLNFRILRKNSKNLHSRMRMSENNLSEVNNEPNKDENPVTKLRNSLLNACDMYKDYQSAIWENKTFDFSNYLNEDSSFLSSLSSKNDPTEILALIKTSLINDVTEMVKFNPTVRPTENWGNSSASPLDGLWKLRFTNAPDATLKPGRRGPATTMQYVNSSSGLFTNIIEFKENKGKVKSLNVIVSGNAQSDNRIDLSFDKVVINRQRSRVGLNKISIPIFKIPFLNNIRSLINRMRSSQSKSNTYLEILYIDDDLRIHRTGKGYLFLQTKLYDVWDPMVC